MIESPYRRGADDGFLFGLYLTALFAASIFSEQVPLLSLVTLALVVMVPVYVWQRMRSFSRACRGAATFPMLWMQGMVMFACGMALAGVVLTVYMKWINPGFIARQWHMMAALASSPDSSFMQQTGKMAQVMIDNGMVPRPMEIVLQLFLLAVASGSILSMTLGAILTLFHRRRTRKDIDSIINN